ncbi:MAG: DUF1476 family protein [Alphaproteobacteria bacterium]|nr:DUF1476 family protein [Alphaproteobacteria bacterium]
MSEFDKRRQGAESKFVLDAEVKFRATARRNKLLGLWAAEKMGLKGEAAEAYAREVVKSDLEEAGEEDVFRKVRRDLDAKGIQISDHEIRQQMESLMQVAIDQVMAEK